MSRMNSENKHILGLPGNRVEAIVLKDGDSFRTIVLMEKDDASDNGDIGDWLFAEVAQHYGGAEFFGKTTITYAVIKPWGNDKGTELQPAPPSKFQ